jgi:ankyrin repeat protein
MMNIGLNKISNLIKRRGGFIKKRGSVNRANTLVHQAPLHDAAFKGSVLMITTLLEEGANVNARNRYSDIPLHFAAMQGHIEVITALLEAGADVNAFNKDGDTPLHEAAKNGHVEVITALLDAGADPNVRDERGKRAFDVIKTTNPLYGTPTWQRLKDATLDMNE